MPSATTTTTTSATTTTTSSNTAAGVATQTWQPNPTCSAGYSGGTGQNGTFVDEYGVTWLVYCQQWNTKAQYAQGGTNGRGVSACFRGCDKRPSCVAWYFSGSVTGPATGSGNCFYQLSPLSNWETNTAYYAGARRISNGTPQLPCPYYHNSNWVDTAGNVWGVICG